jgi:hypothetical protein
MTWKSVLGAQMKCEGGLRASGSEELEPIGCSS